MRGGGAGSASGGRGETALGGAGATACACAGAWSSMVTVPPGIHGDAPPAVSQGGASGTGLLAISRTRPAATTRTMRASPTAATQAP